MDKAIYNKVFLYIRSFMIVFIRPQSVVYFTPVMIISIYQNIFSISRKASFINVLVYLSKMNHCYGIMDSDRWLLIKGKYFASDFSSCDQINNNEKLPVVTTTQISFIPAPTCTHIEFVSIVFSRLLVTSIHIIWYIYAFIKFYR